jgi:alcohol dehydrogenase class IV|tara:strand:+ start:1924 stop:3057 length:1134 start_codon:yes stop_codon:yes gene_type:complete
MDKREYIGFGSIKNLKGILDEHNPRRIFLVTGENSYSSCGAEDSIVEALGDRNFYRFKGFQENPKIEDVDEGISLYRKFNPDLVIGIGGGSVLDMAKLTNILASQEHSSREYVFGERKIESKGKPLILIPTTSGTGSEATHFAVVYIGKDKYSLANQMILPDYSIVDPNFMLNLPKNIIASTGMDALSQAIESYWAVASTDESKGYSRAAIELVMGNLELAANTHSEESILAMSKAANLSGKAINITKTTAPHALSYAFTSHFGVPHGHATGLTLGQVLVYNSFVKEGDVNDPRGVEYVKKTIKELNALIGNSDAYFSRAKIKTLMNHIGLETRLSVLGIEKEEDIDLIARSVNIERLNNNPRTLTTELIKKLLKNI